MFMKVWNVVYTILVCVLAVLAILLAGVRLAGVVPYAVLSGSMSPAYPTGALIYVKPVKPQQVSMGDPITFRLSGTAVATHRVVRIDADNECFYTKGDANVSPDGQPVAFASLIGTPVFSIPLLGYVSNYISMPPGLYVASAAVLIMIVSVFIPRFHGKHWNDSRETVEKNKRADAVIRKPPKTVKPANEAN